jgi:hypothetical protein
MSIRCARCAGEVNMSHEVWDAISPDAKDLVKRMLHPNPFQRITAAQILEHPWLQEETDEVRACCFGGCGECGVVSACVALCVAPHFHGAFVLAKLVIKPDFENATARF